MRQAVRQDCRKEEEREEVGVVWGIAVGVGSVGGVYRQLQAGSSSSRGSGALEWPSGWCDGVFCCAGMRFRYLRRQNLLSLLFPMTTMFLYLLYFVSARERSRPCAVSIRPPRLDSTAESHSEPVVILCFRWPLGDG